MYMYFRPVQRDDVSPEEAAMIDKSLEDIPEMDMTAMLLVAEVHGPAAFYEVGPHTWGEAGLPDRPLDFQLVKKLTCDSGPVTFVVMVQTELLPKMKLGIVWLQPWERGLQVGAIRSDLNGNLEEWVFHSRIRKLFSRKGVTGRWRSKKDQSAVYGPTSQPWERPTSKSLAFLKQRFRNKSANN